MLPESDLEDGKDNVSEGLSDGRVKVVVGLDGKVKVSDNGLSDDGLNVTFFIVFGVCFDDDDLDDSEEDIFIIRDLSILAILSF